MLLKNDGAIPVMKHGEVLVGGAAADDIGLQCGGWTAGWQGASGPIVPGVTLLEALKRATGDAIVFAPSGDPGIDREYDVGIVCVAEEPYAEGMGDREVPSVRAGDAEAFDRMAAEKSDLARVTIDDVGHAPTLLEPKASQAIDGFLSGL